ncbi:MAG: Fe-S-containing protein, partial [Dehalococcoidia bacterium]
RTKRGNPTGTGREQVFELHNRSVNRTRLAITVVVLAAFVATMVLLAACPGPGEGGLSSGSIVATWIEPQSAGDTVSIPVREVENHRNVHFTVETEDRDMHFMAYVLNGQIHVRASVCPPCWAKQYSLDNDILVCDMCATTFRARTGDGIRGACVNYPKASVAYEIVDGIIVMGRNDLIAAYENTLEPGWP